MRNIFLENALVQLQQVERDLTNQTVSRSSLESHFAGILSSLTRAQNIKQQKNIGLAIDLIQRALTMSQVLSDLRGFNFPQPYSPFVGPQQPNFAYSPVAYQQTSRIFPMAAKPSNIRLYEILMLVRQAKNLVIQAITYTK